MQDPELQPSQSPAIHPNGRFSALLQLSGLWKPVQRLPVPSAGPKVRTEPEGLMDEKLACTVKVLTSPMKGANGFGIELGEQLRSSVWFASLSTNCRLARDGRTLISPTRRRRRMWRPDGHATRRCGTGEKARDLTGT